jgi:uncharacterized protein YqgV (UPF0045/DUF77 family)
MQAHFRIYRLDTPSLTQDVAEVIGILQCTSLQFQAGSMGTTIQGDLEEVMEAICLCHRRLAHDHRILTSIVIDDDRTPGMMRTTFHKESQLCKASS